MNRETIRAMLQEVMQKLQGTGDVHGIKSLLLITNMIENRMRLNKQGSKKELNNIHLAPPTIYELYSWIDKYEIRKKDNL